ncbi:Gfo/Idh/MocA family protein [Aeromicrobium sp.]|uniref:Gfo/Idh/MocA family protein n=1 Tax=Aeromicrobium sp. TaxID=1871063 RepID=UPI003FA52645
MSHQFRIGVAGAGSWAAIAHIPAVLANTNATLAGIADPDADRLRDTGEVFNVAARFTDHRDLIANGRLDALVVATPHTTHFQLATDALDAGLHVLVEKPFTVHSEDARTLISKARDRGLHIVVGFTSQFSPAAILTKKMLTSGALGDLNLLSTLFTSNFDEFVRGDPGDETEVSELSPVGGPSVSTYADPSMSGGGQGQSQVSHAVGMQLWATGLRAKRVTAFMSSQGARVDLVDAISYQLDNGAIGSVAATGALGPRQEVRQELHYFGTRGSLHHNFVTGELVFTPWNGAASEVLCEPLTPEQGLALISAPVDCLVALMKGEGINYGPAEAATTAVELIEAAYISAGQNGTPVEIDGHGK